MLEAEIRIEDELAVKAYSRAFRFTIIRDLAREFATSLGGVWVLIAITDIFLEEGHLVWKHFLLFLALWIVLCVYGYYDWRKRIRQSKGWSFHAKLDEQGVVAATSTEYVIRWSQYKGYLEYDDYLQIVTQDGTVSFLPKTPELFEIVEFTKEHIPAK